MFEHLTDEQMAKQVAEILGLREDTALRAVQSDDPDLGRRWGESLLESHSRHRELQQGITEHRANIRRAAAV